MGIEIDYLAIGVSAGMIIYWVGYYFGHKAGMKTGAWIASIDPNARQWWR